MRALLLALVVGVLVLPVGALADPPTPVAPVPIMTTPPIPAPPPPIPQPEWSLLISGDLAGPRQKNRIYYAPAPSYLKPLLRYFIPRPSYRRKLRVNFSEYGLLLVFHQPVLNAEASIGPVALVPNGLAVSVNLHLLNNMSHVPIMRVPFFLIRVKKSTLPTPVEKLYIWETTN